MQMPRGNRRQSIFGEAFGADGERVKPFSEDDRGEDRKFKTSLAGFGYGEKRHEASRYVSKTVATVILSSKCQVVIPREMRDRLNIKPGQKVSITTKDGVIHIVPIPSLRRSERGRLPKLKPFVREKHDRFG